MNMECRNSPETTTSRILLHKKFLYKALLFSVSCYMLLDLTLNDTLSTKSI